MTSAARGPLKGVKVLEFAGIGPSPFAAMMLSDMGATVLRIDRKDGPPAGPLLIDRGRSSIAMDLKSPDSIKTCLQMITTTDVIIEGFRPGVMERLGLGPDVALAHNPRLVYGRMTGWGQTGPLAHAAGHDLNYIAISGALAAIGAKDGAPVPPLNLVGDFGGGSLYLAFGIAAALFHAARTGTGQVVDASVTDGAINLMTMFYGMYNSGDYTTDRGSNMLDGGAHYYNTYQCADGKFISIAPIEAKFYALLCQKLNLQDPAFELQNDQAAWPQLKEKLIAIFKTKSRAEWTDLLEGTDVCFAPVLDMAEAADHPHNKARQNIVDVWGHRQPAPAPRFSATPGAIQGPPPERGQHDTQILRDFGLSNDMIDQLKETGIFAKQQ